MMQIECTETHSYLRVNSANILRNQRLLAVSCGKLWIFVEFRLEVKPPTGTVGLLRQPGTPTIAVDHSIYCCC